MDFPRFPTSTLLGEGAGLVPLRAAPAVRIHTRVRHRLAAPRLRQHGQQKPRNGSGLTSVWWLQQEGAGGREIKANDITRWHGSARRELFLAGPGPGCLGKRLQMLLRAPGAGLPAPPRGHPARGRALRVLLDARIHPWVPGVPVWTLGCRVPAR